MLSEYIILHYHLTRARLECMHYFATRTIPTTQNEIILNRTHLSRQEKHSTADVVFHHKFLIA